MKSTWKNTVTKDLSKLGVDEDEARDRCDDTVSGREQ